MKKGWNKGGRVIDPITSAVIIGWVIFAILCSSCAPSMQAQQVRLKDKADHKKDKPKNNYLPLIGIGLLSAWVVGRINEDN